MKILAIRGKNLASLSQAFSVDFTVEPLDSAGLFAITGPTGAGKSTLLDALCLALYDDTPRLLRATAKGISLPDVAGETIAPRDTRTLLRRGASEGFAEVDFAGSDQVIYRARWHVRRARNKSTGKLQAVDMSLVRLPDMTPVGGKLKSEVLPEIEARVGLSFAQFTRAVLLAQNEFAAFLKASDDDRAELLETLTGTDQFGRISIQAFQRAKQQREQAQRLQTQLTNIQPWSEQERQAHTKQHNLAQQHADELQQKLEKLQQKRQWQQQWQQLQSAQQLVEQHWQQAVQARELASERRAYFQQVEAVQPARLHLVAFEQAQQACNQGQNECQLADQMVGQAQATLNQIKLDLQANEQQWQAALQCQADAALELQQAKTLDTVIEASLPACQDAKQEWEQAQQALQLLQQQQLQAQNRRSELEHKLATSTQWLEQHATRQGLAEAWARWETLLAQATSIRQQTLDTRCEVEQAQQHYSLQQAQHQYAQQQQAHAQQALLKAQMALIEANHTYANFNAEDLAQRKHALEQQRTQLAETQVHWQTLQATQNQYQQLMDKVQQFTVMEAELAEGLTMGRLQLPRLEQTWRQAERSWQVAEQACHTNAESLRATLQDNTPCPVCGSLQHPYVNEHAPLRAMLDSLRVEAEGWLHEYNKCATDIQQQKEQLSLTRQQLQQTGEQWEQAAQTLQQLQDVWQRLPWVQAHSSLEPLDWSNGLKVQASQLEQDMLRLHNEESALRAALRERDAAQQAVNEQQRHYAQQAEQAHTVLLALQQAEQHLHTLQQRQERQQQRLQSLLEQLQGAFVDSDWQAQWQADPYDFQQTCQQKVQQWQHQQQDLTHTRQQLATAGVEDSALASQVSQAQTRFEQAQSRFHALQQEWHSRCQARAQLLQGQPVASVETALQTEVDVTQAAVVKVQELQQQASHAFTQAQTRYQHSQLLHASQQTHLHGAQAELQHWLQQAGMALDIAALRRLLSHEDAWLKQERHALQQLDTAVSNSQTLLTERTYALQQHEQQRPAGELAAEHLQAELAQAQQMLHQQRKQLAELELELQRDEERRVSSCTLQAQHTEQLAQARVWEQLNELIGSADGKKFRNFAQQYSLDVLLGYTNRHLADLSRRYVLQRVKDSLALLVIDQDLGGEARSVHSLSGGESFLVSLALALGLASLSSHRVKVESLFIDEGFGSLDADSLQVAMDALDSLQAQGRKVGVISHVQEMTERIGVQIRVKRLSGGQSRLVMG